MKKSISRGFTLIELLIVIAIIAILTGIIVTSLSGSRAKSRDAQRVSDISQIQLALEQYFDRCQQYPIVPPPYAPFISDVPASALSSISNGCPPGSGISLATFISQIPTPPSGKYGYVVNLNFVGATNVPTDYVLHAALETKVDALQDTLIFPGSTPGWFPANAIPPPQSTCNAPTQPTNGLFDYCIGSH